MSRPWNVRLTTGRRYSLVVSSKARHSASLDVGREREDDALHLGDVAIAGAEICGEGDDRGHAPAARELPVAVDDARDLVRRQIASRTRPERGADRSVRGCT